MRVRCLVIAIILIGFGATPRTAPQRATTQRKSEKLKRVDAAVHDISLRRLRRDVLKAADPMDRDALRRLMSTVVKIDYDKELTPAQAVAEIESYSATDQALFWQDLREAVTLGFFRDGMGACAPSVIFELPDDVDGSFQQPIGIIAAGVKVRRAPERTSQVIDILSYDIVAMGPELARPATDGQFGGQYEWLQIKTPKGEFGWVLSKYLRERGARRFCFEKKNGLWKLTGWATGD